VRIGWESPVSEVVNPAFIELNGRGGLGWLEGFNEMVVRCGYEWVGHPGMDKGVLLPLHGLAANIPASKVVLSIDEEPPYTIRLKGELKPAIAGLLSLEKHRHYWTGICHGLRTRHQLGLQSKLSAYVEPSAYDWSQRAAPLRYHLHVSGR
jgi:Domain of unknown function (DUF4432)